MDNHDELVLKWMLGQAYRAEKRKQWLDERLHMINERRNSPIGGHEYSPMPRSGYGSDGAASILLTAAEIEERIYCQKAQIDVCITRVMDILDLLPIDSLGRDICEMRYLDMMTWRKISERIPLTRSACNRHYKKAIRELLGKKKVMDMIDSSREEYEDYVASTSKH